MDESLKKRWVEALRSGEYKQGSFYLRKEDSYCCLGVLYEVVMGKDGWQDICEGVWRINDGSKQILPYDFTLEVGLDRHWMNKLVDLNDNGASFEEIAKVIEERA